jgi:hypothetical protein
MVVDMLKLASATVSEIPAWCFTSRGRRIEYLFDDCAGKILLDLRDANPKLLAGCRERHEDGKALVSSNSLAPVGESLSCYVDQVAGFRKSCFGHPFTITASLRDWKYLRRRLRDANWPEDCK